MRIRLGILGGQITQPLQFIGVAVSSSTESVAAYPFSAAGFGAKYANPNVLSGLGVDIEIRPQGDAIVIATDTVVPYAVAYSFSAAGFGTKFSNPSPTITTNQSLSVNFNKQGTVLVVNSNLSPGYNIYTFSSSGWGTKFAESPVVVFSRKKGSFTTSGGVFARTAEDNNGIHAYTWLSSGWGIKFANPSTTFPDDVNPPFFSFPVNFSDVSFSPTDNAVAVAAQYSSSNIDRRISVYAFNNGFGTLFSSPAANIDGPPLAISFSNTN